MTHDPENNPILLGIIAMMMHVALVRAFAKIADKEDGDLSEIANIDPMALSKDEETSRLMVLIKENPNNAEWADLMAKALVGAKRLGMLQLLETSKPMGSA